MPQLQLPIFPSGLTFINRQIGFEKKDGRIYYFHGLLPVFSHDEEDLESFRFITSQLVVGGNVKQADIVKAFGVSSISVKRSVKRLREQGARGFFKEKKGRSAHVLTPEIQEKAQRLLYNGYNPSEVARRLKLKANTIRKAIKAGRLHKKNKEREIRQVSSQTKSERNILDAQAGMGMGCTREEERVQAAWGQLDSAGPVFMPNADVKSAGVLLSVPSLLVNGLLKYCNQHFSLTRGYYSLQFLLIILAFAALLRIKSIERVRYCDPGELGKVFGLDRIPEVRTLRKKIKHLSEYGSPENWSKHLAQFWMEKDPDMAGILYVDGHVRVYHGTQTALPKRYVAREKLCLQGLTDYWINDALGQPFFVITQVVNAGLLAVLREKIVPELLEKVPKQPTHEELNSDPYLFRFGMVFDREGYSPVFFKEMWGKRIACYTYQKYVHEEWPTREFKETEVIFPNGEVSSIKLAERGVYFQKQKLWVLQIRKLTESSHQTALVTTDYHTDAAQVAGAMFSRWSQENFFKYMMEHYGIHRLIDYQVEKMDETIRVVNPRYKEVETQIRSKTAKLSRKRAEYGALILEGEIEEDAVKGICTEEVSP